MPKKEDSAAHVFQLVPQQSTLPIEFDDPIRTVFEFWRAVMGHPRAQLGPTRRKAIGAALQMGYSVDDLRLAVVGCRCSPRHQGQNENGEIYDDIELICRNETKIDRFMALGEQKVNSLIAKDREKQAAANAAPASPMPPEVRAKLDALFRRATEARRP